MTRVLQIRLSEELHEAVKARGGSPWARQLISDAIAQDLFATKVAPPVSPTQTAHNGAGGEAQPSHSASLPPVPACPRWMHHRKGVYCKTCETTP